MSRISDLIEERENTRQRLAKHRAQLDEQRRKATPDRSERGRLRELVDEDERELAAIDEDVRFERDRLVSDEQIALRAAARAKRDAALKTHKAAICSAWLSIDSKLRALTAEAAALRELTTRTAGDLNAVAWAHYHPDANRSGTASGLVADIVLGDPHAHAVALLLEDFVRALPANIERGLYKRFGIQLAVRTSFQSGTTITAANDAAHKLLSERCTEWMAEPQLEEVAA